MGYKINGYFYINDTFAQGVLETASQHRREVF